MKTIFNNEKKMKNQKNKAWDIFSSLIWCLSIAWKTSKFYTIIQIGSQILTPLFAILSSFLGKYLINLLAGTWAVSNSIRTLVILSFALLLIAFGKVSMDKLTQYSQSMQGELIRNSIAISMMNRALTSDLAYFDNSSYYDKYLSTFHDSFAIANIFWSALTCISAFVSFILVFIVLAQANVLYGLLMLIAAIPASIISANYTKIVYGLSLEQINSERQLNYFQSISIDRRYAQDLRLFGIAENLKNRYSRLWEKLFSKRQQTTRKGSLYTALLTILPEIVIIFIGFDIAINVLGKTASVGDYVLYTGLVGQLWGSISQLSTSIMLIFDNNLRIENIKSLDNYKNHVNDIGVRKLDRVKIIEFDHVKFSYPGSNKVTINDVSFLIKPGEKTALVGLNGSGKSTLIKLLLRMYDLDSGSIRINGADIREYSLTALRSNFSVYFQEMQNYCFSLRENFTISDETHPDSDSAIITSLEESCCVDIPKRATRGLETGLSKFLDPDGLQLSEGEQQKLALARSFFRRNTVLILDEPSSNLDPKAEHEIFNSLRELTNNKITLFTSHRLSNVFLADKIILLENGQILEEGSQEQLLRNNKRFAELFHYQQEKFIFNLDK